MATDDAEAVSGSADDAAEAADDAVTDAAEPPAAAGGYLAALDDADSKVGGIASEAKGSGADSVTAAIARLAELRDAGAITAEEFDVRKRELLDRL
ncbi:MAG: SHOCT domain-containing protein [Chloroflexota bacterium]